MAAISPNSDVKICKDVPLDIGYEHTLYQSDKTAQYNRINAFVKYTLADYTYQRVSSNVIRVGMLADLLQDCNYMMFRNTSYLYSDGTAKWFYAFITDVKYINDNTSEITYEIDVMQTYYFDYSIGSCYVEREHTLTDGINDNYEPEEGYIGDYVTLQQQDLFYKWSESTFANRTMGCFIFYVPNETLVGCTIDGNGDAVISTTSTPSGSEGGGIWSAGQYMAGTYVSVPIMSDYPNKTAANIDACLAALVDANANIYNVALIPYNTHPLYNGTYLMNELNYFLDNSNNYYYPKNKKLFHFPYKKVLVVNSNGQQKEYKYELFAGTTSAGFKTATFSISLTRFPQAEAFIRPTSYASITFTNGLTYNNFPTYSWSEDSFSKWWAQNSQSAIMGAVGSAITSIATLIAGGPVGVPAGIGTAANTLTALPNQLIAAYNTPDTINGSASSNLTNTRLDHMGFTVYEMAIRPEIAQTIDDYFSRYGYTINKLKQPNIRSAAASALRPQWNYIKCQATVVHGNDMNAEAERKIESIYNKGITFWINPANVGNYSLSNDARG